MRTAAFVQGVGVAFAHAVPERAAAPLRDVLDRLGAGESGSFLGWRGQPIPW
jgi:hypothetical protein